MLNDANTPHSPSGASRESGGSEPSSAASLPTHREFRTFHEGDLFLGRYRVKDILGRGGMGIVYRCADEVGGIDVGLKALPPEVSRDTSEMEEVRENFKLVSRLSHPHIAQIRTLERDTESGDYYLIMECVDGISLRQWRKKTFPDDKMADLEQILPLLRQMASALDYAHSQRIIHRDIKQGNIMVQLPSGDTAPQPSAAKPGTSATGSSQANGPWVKILDFGLAAQIHTSLSRVSRVKYETSGTGPYMAPEQWRGKCQDAATDQYALAVVAYELLSGKCPFMSHEMGALREAVLNDNPERITGLGNSAWNALKKGLAKERKDRFPTCCEFIDAMGGETCPKVDMRVIWRSLLAVGLILGAIVLYFKVIGPSMAARQEQAVRREQMARQDQVKREQIKKLLADARSKMSNGDPNAAATILADAFKLDPENLEATEVQREIEKGVDERRARTAKVDADMAWERLQKKNIDGAQGFEKRLVDIEKQMRLSMETYEKNHWGEAFIGYHNVILMIEGLEASDALRQDAAKAAKAAEEARQSVNEEVTTAARAEWTLAVQELASGATAFESGDFASAVPHYQAVVTGCRAAVTKAQQVAACRLSKEAFDKAMSASDTDLLKRYGGQAWKELERLQRTASTGGQDPVADRQAYDQAVARLPEVLKEAKVAKEQADQAAAKALADKAAAKELADKAAARELADKAAAKALADKIAAKERVLADYRAALKAVGGKEQIARNLPKEDPNYAAAVKSGLDLLAAFEAGPTFKQIGPAEKEELAVLKKSLEDLFSTIPVPAGAAEDETKSKVKVRVRAH